MGSARKSEELGSHVIRISIFSICSRQEYPQDSESPYSAGDDGCLLPAATMVCHQVRARSSGPDDHQQKLV